MLKNNTHRMVIAGLLAAVGIILPLFSSHIFGVPGTTLLPMHIPILLCGLLCGGRYGALCAIVVPVLSCVLTGMPPVYPMLPIMLVQLLAMSLVGGFMYQKMKTPLFLALPCAMISGWILYGVMFYALLFVSGGSIKALSVSAALVQGVPGILIQLVIIPPILSIAKKMTGKSGFENPSSGTDELMNQAIGLIKSKNISCAIIKDGSILHTADGRGVSPLLNMYRNSPDKLKNAVVVDKIIGKAAAMILVLGGAKKVYGMIMSTSGRDYLERHGIKAESGRCVDLITNRSRDGICPIENAVMEIEDPQEGLAILSATIDNLIKAAANQ